LLRDVEESCTEVLVLKEGSMATYSDLEAERRTNRRYLQLDLRGAVSEFGEAMRDRGCEYVQSGPRSLRMILPEGLEVRDLYSVADDTGVQIRRLNYRRDSLEDIFFRAMEVPNGSS
jgi:ABC-2 type transport system ATP-binding protein